MKKFIPFKRIKKSKKNMNIDDVLNNNRKYEETSEQYEDGLLKDYEEYESEKIK